MLAIALRHLPQACCLVPEKREERTTEGGLDAAAQRQTIRPCVERLNAAGIRVALFIEPDPKQLAAAKALDAPVVELHTGAYAEATGAARQRELDRLIQAAAEAAKLGLECHAGHGLTFDNVGPVAAIPEVVELNIGHFLIGEAVFGGLDSAIRRMRAVMNETRGSFAVMRPA
jgi:pyridoxine 5-phosphate synthase